MAAHRSPGARVHRHSARGPAPSVAGRAGAAAALGAVSTGAFTALMPAVEASLPAQTPAPLHTTLASLSVPLHVAEAEDAETATHFLPIRTAAVEGRSPADVQLAQLDKAVGIAAEIAELHAKQEREQAEQAKIDALIAEGGLDGWIAEALHVMDLPQSLAPAVKKIILKESNGNPKAINNWDANARRGTPSQGLMQTIPSTFKKFVHPSFAHLSITHPVANITAGVRYMIATYGLSTLEQGGRRSASGAYLGY